MRTTHNFTAYPSTEETIACRVALISSNDLIAEGISQGLEQHDSIVLQDRFDDHGDLGDTCHPGCYPVVLVNARLIQYPLSDFFQRLQDATGPTRIVVFGAEGDPRYLKNLMRAGVYGFVPLEASVHELCSAILAVCSGQLWFDKSLLDEMVIDAIEFERMIEQSIKEAERFKQATKSDEKQVRDKVVFSMTIPLGNGAEGEEG